MGSICSGAGVGAGVAGAGAVFRLFSPGRALWNICIDADEGRE